MYMTGFVKFHIHVGNLYATVICTGPCTCDCSKSYKKYNFLGRFQDAVVYSKFRNN
jgi:hypothetical protein